MFRVGAEMMKELQWQPKIKGQKQQWDSRNRRETRLNFALSPFCGSKRWLDVPSHVRVREVRQREELPDDQIPESKGEEVTADTNASFENVKL